MTSFRKEFKINRRSLLLGMSALATAASFTQSPGLAASNGHIHEPDSIVQFMLVSKLLVPHELDPFVGHKIHNALSDAEEGFDNTVTALQDFIMKNAVVDVEHLMPALTDTILKNSALKIISAWYSGVVHGKSGDRVVAFEEALMFKVTNDVMTIPSYAKSAPNAWDATAVPLLNMPSF
ncbi:sorbitol dehydrogenase family protein [Novacetimonas hansenii]|uniref:sorbitol dehydrogenase family protein n=1 Tax=Novacetimonas hansenii TaxID=436 RepID=UPI00177F91C6|nr:sorbitol dehydrogenase family protein [Novacetimonas hansenii]QOF94499.1 sorbitol dehydrogenase family protein [Novacetimonas hansenii]